MSSIYKIFYRYWQLFVLIGFAAILFCIPLFFWGNLYISGGDDARLYYIFPLEYLKNFSFNVMSGNTLGGNSGYVPVSYSAPTIALIYILKVLFPFLNTQFLVYGIILALGFIFMFLFFQEWITNKTTYTYWGSIASSVYYILSPYIMRTFFQTQYISIFLIMVVPGCLYFFVTGLKRKSMSRVVVGALIYSFFSSTVYSFPWFLPVILTLTPLLIFLMIRHGLFFAKAIIVIFGIIVMTNIYWIIHYVIPLMYPIGETNFTGSLLSTTFKQQNHDLITAISHLNDPVNQVVNYLRTSWFERLGTTVMQSFGLMYLFVILLAGSMLATVKKNTRFSFLVSVIGLLVAMIFITPNLGLWSLHLFEFFNDHVPFFGIFRHMYDKFALSMAFYYAFTLCMAFVVLGESGMKRVLAYICVVIVFIYTIVNAISYIHPNFNDSGYSTRISEALNDDYIHLTEYIGQMKTSSRFVWYPMTFPGYVYISDQQNSHHYYIGISTLQIFSRSSDLPGFYGIQTASDPDLHWRFLDLLKAKNYASIGRVFERLNIGYVIVNHEPIPDGAKDSFNQFNFVSLQNDQYLQQVIGEKLQDFGSRYSLYAVRKDQFAPTVFLSDKPEEDITIDQKIPFRKEKNGDYITDAFSLDKPTQVILLEPYNNLWKLNITNSRGESVIGNVKHTMAYGYGNAWLLNPHDIDSSGSAVISLSLHFWPNSLKYPALLLSILSLMVSVIYCLITYLRKKKYI